MQPMLNIALRAARAAGEEISRSVERLDLIKSEQVSVADFVKTTCQNAEQLVVQTIQKAYPSHTIIGEYTGEHKPLREGTPFTWHLNPIDSISNFANGLPAIALCVAGYNENNRIEHAVIHNPMAGEEFTASRGSGAQLNGKRIRVSNHRTIEGALLGTGFLGRKSDKPYLNEFQDIFKNITLANGQVYSGGSAALNLAYTAAGRLDGFYQIGLSQWEMEAGLLIVQEAGALVGDLSGGNNYRESGNLVCGNAKMFKALLKTIRPSLSADLK